MVKPTRPIVSSNTAKRIPPWTNPGQPWCSAPAVNVVSTRPSVSKKSSLRPEGFSRPQTKQAFESGCCCILLFIHPALNLCFERHLGRRQTARFPLLEYERRVLPAEAE